MIASRRAKRRQSGVALITAVLIVALASIAAAAMLSSANLAIHRASTLSDTERAWWYADGIETWVKSILVLDQQHGKQGVDYLGEPWAKPVDYLPVDEGALKGGIIDLQGRFNLNLLSVGANSTDPAFLKNKALFEGLIDKIEALQGVPTSGLAEAIRDWTDGDIMPMGFGGAEDSEYSSLPVPYRTANRWMTSVTELLAVKGVTKQIYLALRNYVCALPGTQPKINVNTASPELLMALGMPAPAVTQFIESRTEKPAETTAGFWTFAGAGPAPPNIDVKTDYFLLHGEAFIGSSHLALYSVVHRQPNGPPVVISRSQDAD